jgi:GNAT superfamily N-acetyltransferase
MTFEIADSADPAVIALATAQQDELRERYRGDLEPGVKPTAEDVLLAVLVRDEDGAPVGCGALRALDAQAVELKRMYVIPPRRGRGLARAILARLEDEARARGFTIARLETGGLQHEAINLYASSGYRRITCFGDYAGVGLSRCFEREL